MAERNELVESGIFFYPALVINSQIFRGDMEASAVMVALCAGFQNTPEACLPHVDKPSKHSGSDSSDSGISVWAIVLIVVGALIALMVILYLYRRWIKREMNNEMRMQVSSAVSQYIALSESRDNKS
jgi:hypothetical protein